LNLRRYHGKQETIIYGLGLGLGFGSIYPPASLLIPATNIDSTVDLVYVLLGAIGLLFLHGTTGALIGYGIYQEKLAKYYILAVVILIIANFIRIDYRIQWLNLVIGIILYIYIQKKIIGIIAHQSQQRKRPSQSNP
jgi:O-antigen ligase